MFLTNNTFSVSRALWGTFYGKSFPVIRFVCSYNELCSLWMGVALHLSDILALDKNILVGFYRIHC